MSEQIIRIITYAGIVQGPFVAFLLNSRGVRKSRANVFLSVLLVSLSFTVAHLQWTVDVLIHFSVKVYSVGDPTFFLVAPLLWFYTKELTGERVKLSWKSVLHFLPFLSIIILSLSFSHIESESIVQVLQNSRGFGILLFWIGIVVQFSGYLWAIQQKWIKYQHTLEQEVSNTENVSISWVRFFMAVFLFINLLFLFCLFMVIHFKDRSWQGNAIALTFSVSIFALGYKGIRQKEIFNTTLLNESGNDQNAEAIKQTEPAKFDQALIDRLLNFMNEQKPYLDPELTLSDLSKSLQISRGVLSQMINTGLGDNFYNFINKYRVEEVKKLMTDPMMKNLNLLGLALEAGFKSKSTFNLIFKRFTGLTPSEYKKNLKE